jgi:uncharacterized protein
LCCNGVIFADVELQPGDDVARLRELGLRLQPPLGGARPKFAQPCAAHDGCRCGIYTERPRYCREFVCLLLKAVRAGRVEMPAALRLIQATRQRVDKIKALLRRLGDTEETVALRERFRRTSDRLQASHLPQADADLYGRLTLEVHKLNRVLMEQFYSG